MSLHRRLPVALPPCRLGTATADVPAKLGDRITVVCAPQRSFFAQRRLLSAAPHGTKPGVGAVEGAWVCILLAAVNRSAQGYAQRHSWRSSPTCCPISSH